MNRFLAIVIASALFSITARAKNSSKRAASSGKSKEKQSSTATARSANRSKPNNGSGASDSGRRGGRGSGRGKSSSGGKLPCPIGVVVAEAPNGKYYTMQDGSKCYDTYEDPDYCPSISMEYLDNYNIPYPSWINPDKYSAYMAANQPYKKIREKNGDVSCEEIPDPFESSLPACPVGKVIAYRAGIENNTYYIRTYSSQTQRCRVADGTIIENLARGKPFANLFIQSDTKYYSGVIACIMNGDFPSAPEKIEKLNEIAFKNAKEENVPAWMENGGNGYMDTPMYIKRDIGPMDCIDLSKIQL